MALLCVRTLGFITAHENFTDAPVADSKKVWVQQTEGDVKCVIGTCPQDEEAIKGTHNCEVELLAGVNKGSDCACPDNLRVNLRAGSARKACGEPCCSSQPHCVAVGSQCLSDHAIVPGIKKALAGRVSRG